MTDDRFERELRAFLVGRAPNVATPALRARISAVSREGPTTRPGWRSRSIGAWRAVVGLAAAAAVAVLIFAALALLGNATVRDRDAVGRPSTAPAASETPFVAAPTGFFTSAAVADAERRLDHVFATTGVEATLIIQPATRLDELSTPPGWPAGYDRDHDGRRDVTAVAGITSDGTIVCCLTIAGPTIDQARERLYWQPLDQPSALDDELSGTTPQARDAALARFVHGIEDLSAGIIEVGIGPESVDVIRAILPIILVVALVALGVVGLRPRTLVPGLANGPVRDRPAVDGLDPLAPEAIEHRDTREGTDVPPASPNVAAVWSDRRFVLIALAALGGLVLLGVIDAMRTGDPSVRLDPTLVTIGITRPALPVVPGFLVATTFVALVAYATRGGWWRRLGVSALIVLLAGSGWLALDLTRPSARQMDIAWASSPNGKVVARMVDGLDEVLSYGLSPGETFTLAGVVRNNGPVPLNILGLGDVRRTGANPYVASIVGLGWVPQPVDDGRVHVLSAAPESASSGWPITVAPGEEIAFVGLGRAGECAKPGGKGPVLPLTHIAMTYRVLGIERTEEVGLPAAALVAAKEICTVEIPGGTITYGPPP
jgi:hypothetical protein